MQRTRTVTWQDPLAAHTRGRELSGLEHMRLIASGEIPGAPIAALMGFAPTVVEEGSVTFAGEPGEHLYNPIGMVHGGFALTLLDSAMGCAVQTLLPAGVAYTSLEVKGNFTRAISSDTGRVLAIGTVVHPGGRVMTAEGRVVQESTGKLLAHGTTTCLVFRP